MNQNCTKNALQMIKWSQALDIASSLPSETVLLVQSSIRSSAQPALSRWLPSTPRNFELKAHESNPKAPYALNSCHIRKRTNQRQYKWQLSCLSCPVKMFSLSLHITREASASGSVTSSSFRRARSCCGSCRSFCRELNKSSVGSKTNRWHEMFKSGESINATQSLTNSFHMLANQQHRVGLILGSCPVNTVWPLSITLVQCVCVCACLRYRRKKTR